MRGVIADSSNIGTVLMARQLDKQKLHDYLVSFGLGSKTNICPANPQASSPSQT